MSYRITADIQLRPSQTGLTLKAQLVDAVGVNVGGAITTGFAEIGRGSYLWDYSAIPDGHRGGVKILNAADDTLVAFASIAPESAENIDAKVSSRLAASSYTAPDNATISAIAGYVDTEVAAIKAKTDTLGAGRVTTVSPVSVSGDMQIIRGDDYAADDGASRVFEWSDDESVWPDLEGATITFKCKSVEAEATFVEGTPNKIRLELSTTDTSGLPVGRPRFSIVATLANEHVVTLIVGSIRFIATEGLS